MAVAAACGGPTLAAREAGRTSAAAAPVAILDARSHVVIHVAPAVMAREDLENVASMPEAPRRAEEERQRVRESVVDLQRVLAQTSGANVEIVTESPPRASASAGEPYRIVIGSLAEAVQGAVGIHALYAQGFRVVVREHDAFLYGESGLATSYAVYELLDRLKCRWFIPGPLGEVLPKPGPLALPRLDERRAPGTFYRGVWYADDAWKRRNRQGGLLLDAGHALELRYVTDADRKKHPEWKATIKGKPHPSRLKWSSPALADHIADRILTLHAEDGAPSYSIAPDDGAEFDDSTADRALDAADFDPTMGITSLTDRFLVLGNRIATRVVEKEPELLLGFLAYVQYTRPPVREQVHPNLVPQIAPITYARAHPMSDDRAPGNADLRRGIEGWGKKSKALSVYFYGWFLSDPVAPNPMITKWGHDVPFVLAHNGKLWQPETLPTFDSSMHALYMGMRLAFDPRLRPADVIAEMEQGFYGAAAPAMHAYWRYVDALWVDTPEYSGGEHGHARRFTRERLKEMRRLLDAGKAAATTDVERKRVELADDSLSLFEDLMAMRFAFLEGRHDGLETAGDAYKKRATALGDKWEHASAFAKVPYAPEGVYAKYYEAFQQAKYADATRLAKSHVTDRLVPTFRYEVDHALKTADPARDPRVQPGFDDAAWKTTNVTLETWSSLGLHDYFGAVWYRAVVPAKPPPPGKRALLWLGDVDGQMRVFVNGREARYTKRPGGPATAEGFAVPLAFDVTSLLVDGENTIVVHGRRTTLNELGIGGLDGPVVLAHAR